MTNDMEAASIARLRRTLWRTLGMTSVCAFVVSWFVWGPFGVLFYASGLLNLDWVFILSPVLLLLIPAALIYLPILLLRTVRWWPVFDSRGRWLRVLAVIALLAFVASFGAGFARLTPSPFDMFVRGF